MEHQFNPIKTYRSNLLLSGILILLTYSLTNVKVFSISYDSTYVLAINQKYAIPENVVNGDFVGIWKKTYTWRSGNPISYSIKTNYKSAFSIDKNTGLITIDDAKKINSKILNQDTVINLIIRTTDSGLGFEDDTCQIRVKENKYCVFIDYNSSGSGAGTRSKPINIFPSIKAGYGYFIKRGNIVKNKSYDIPGVQSSARRPTVLSAYSSGNNPIFDGSNLDSGEAFDFKNMPFPSKYFYIYNIDVRNYPSMAFRISTRSSHFGFYNCNFIKNVLTLYTHDLGDIYFFGSTADTLTDWKHELINLESEGSWGPIVKTDASGVNAYNIKSATANNTPDKGYNFRFAISYYSSLSHFWFIGGERSLQVRYPYVKIIDGIITGSSDAGMFLVTHESHNGKPDHLLIYNVLFRNNEFGIYSYNTNINYIAIENSLFDSNMNDGIHFKNGGIDRSITNCSFINNNDDGLELAKGSQQSKNLLIKQNLFVGNKSKSINASNRACADNLKIYNNTIIGAVDLRGSSNTLVENNFYSSIVGFSSLSNNIVIDSISISKYFRDPKKYDYRLMPSAIQTIKLGQQAKIKKSASTTNDTVIGAFDYE